MGILLFKASGVCDLGYWCSIILAMCLGTYVTLVLLIIMAAAIDPLDANVLYELLTLARLLVIRRVQS